MEKTPNYNLNKPGYDDFGDVVDLNANADILDTELKRLTLGIDEAGTDIAKRGYYLADFAVDAGVWRLTANVPGGMSKYVLNALVTASSVANQQITINGGAQMPLTNRLNAEVTANEILYDNNLPTWCAFFLDVPNNRVVVEYPNKTRIRPYEIYVNASTGNDSNSGLSADMPLRTLSAAAARINGTVFNGWNNYLNCAPGDYSSQGAVTFSGLSGGGLFVIRSNPSNRNGCILPPLRMIGIKCASGIRDLTIKSNEAVNDVVFTTYCTDLGLEGVTINGIDKNHEGVFATWSRVSIGSDSVINNCNRAVCAVANSKVYVSGTTGTNNNVALTADGNVSIGRGSGYNISATTAQVVINGGVIR